MIPKRVTVENFLSFSAKTEILFADDEPLWVLGGPNGIGKSAVFDAMTYCLFAQHRGGVDNADSLIHHGRDRFAVSFEFEFGGADYRISRTRSSTGPKQSVERMTGGQWKCEDGIDSVSSVKNWVVETIGLNFASFQASVLLRQGEAEAILVATGRERMTILKSVLGLERFEGLSARIAEEWKARKGELKSLQDKRNATAEVTASQLLEADAAEVSASLLKGQAAEARDDAAAGLNQSDLWVTAEPLRIALECKIAEATARSTEAGRIRADFAAYSELAGILPDLRPFVPLRTSMIDAEPALERLRNASLQAEGETARSHVEATAAAERKLAMQSDCDLHEREAEAGRRACDGQSKFLIMAESVATLAARHAAFPADLDEIAATAVAADLVAKEAFTQARVDKDGCDRDLARSLAARAKFDDLTIGVNCSACGQEVTAEHARKERAAAEAGVAILRATGAERELTLSVAKSSAEESGARRAKLEGEARECAGLVRELAGKRLDLETFGGTSDAGLLKNRIAGFVESTAASERAADAARAGLAILDARIAGLAVELDLAAARATNSARDFTTAEKRFDADRVGRTLLLERIPVGRHGTTTAELAALEIDFARLLRGKIVEEFEDLQRDSARREEWQVQLRELAARIDGIPLAARRPIREAELAHDAAKKAALNAEVNWQTARDISADLQRRGRAFAALVAEILAAEFALKIHTALNGLLGNAGLLRELVRIAEVEIVRFATDTLHKLSEGDLALELSREPKREGEALVLLVRRAESSEPTPVAFLSGSEKFRVALALALGIGQFASGQARPLECVIIDEGFGSLDKVGLRAAAEELNRLKRHLKRIILVSHQEEFTDHFPVVIQLQRTDEGVTATTVRR